VSSNQGIEDNERGIAHLSYRTVESRRNAKVIVLCRVPSDAFNIDLGCAAGNGERAKSAGRVGKAILIGSR
jgi:hypothetical protein